MDYNEAVEATVSKNMARHEVQRHGGNTLESQIAFWNDFLREIGDRQEYTGAEVLNWLGY